MTNENHTQGGAHERLSPLGAGRKRPATLIFVVLAGLLFGCNSEQQQPSAEDAARPSPSRYVVFGIDRSGSYDFVTAGLRELGLQIAKASPGDVFVLRWISGTSYASSEFAGRFEIPKVELPDCSANPYDADCRRSRAEQQGDLQRTKREAVQRALQLHPEVAQNTDIWGFIQAAADWLANAPAESDRWVVMATDLKDNVRHGVRPRLEDISVQVIAFQTDGDIEASLKLREQWQASLAECGVRGVQFHAAEVAQ